MIGISGEIIGLAKGVGTMLRWTRLDSVSSESGGMAYGEAQEGVRDLHFSTSKYKGVSL